MKTHTLPTIDCGPGDWTRRRAERGERIYAVRRAEAVLRIFKDRSTLVDEAVRMDVDIDTVADWVAITLAAIGRALDGETSATPGTDARHPTRRIAS